MTFHGGFFNLTIETFNKCDTKTYTKRFFDTLKENLNETILALSKHETGSFSKETVSGTSEFS